MISKVVCCRGFRKRLYVENVVNIVIYMYMFYLRHGAEEVHDETKPPAKRPTFRGSGYRLGETETEPSEMVAGAPLQESKKQVWTTTAEDIIG